METRKQQLQRMYGFEFSDEFFAFWELAQRADAEAGKNVVRDTLGLSLVGPFDVLAGKFDDVTPRFDPLLHYRYYLDLPEFFTIFCGDTDGLHFGYWLDDPAQGVGCVASYYRNDAYLLINNGDTLFEAVRHQLERYYDGTLELIEDEPDEADAYKADMEWQDSFRVQLMRYATGDRSEIGQEYTDKHRQSSKRAVVAPTYEGIGIVVPPHLYRTPTLVNPHDSMEPEADAAPIMAEAQQALRDGFPGTALQLGHDLWILGADRHTSEAIELLTSAYDALNRPLLAHVTRVHAQNRSLPSVSVLGAKG